MYALQALLAKPARLALTVGGVGLCVVLMLFLVSLYQGVAEGTLAYLRSSPAELWVLQQHSSNVLRSTSLLTLGHGMVVEDVDGVASSSPLLFLLAGAEHGGQASTLYFVGYDLESGVGAPPRLAAGRQVAADDEIVVDRSFARKLGFGVGDELVVHGTRLQVVGLSTSTNLFVVQYAFVSLPAAHAMLGVPGIVSCFQVMLAEGAEPALVAEAIRSELPDVAVFDEATFMENNTREMEAGFLPLVFVVAVLGSVVLAVILGLLLSVQVLEQRLDFAAMKALGAPRRFVQRVVVGQALLLSVGSTCAAVVFFFPMVRLVEVLSPEVTVASSPVQIALVALGVCLTGAMASLVPVRRVSEIHALEVFR